MNITDMLKEFQAELQSVQQHLDDITKSLEEDAALAAPEQEPSARPYRDSTPHLSVGESSFEEWFSTYSPAGKGDKQRARDAYAAGMGDPLVQPSAAPVALAQQEPTDEQIDEMTIRALGSKQPQIMIDAYREFARAVLALRGPAIPEGWQLVPVEPTPEMLKAGQYRVGNLSTEKWFAVSYRAMLAAAPKGEQ